MTRWARQIYFGIIVLITVIGVPLLLLYVSGYRFNYEDFNVTQTGSLAVTTLPKHAHIRLVELEYETEAPTIINQLIPGDYEVIISQDGYTDWHDTVTIQAGTTYQLSNVVLFPQTPEPKLLNAYPEEFIQPYERIADLSPAMQEALSDLDLSNSYTIQIKDAPEITLLDETNQHLYLLRFTGQDVEVTTLGEAVIGFAWDDETDLLVYYSEHEIFVYDDIQSTNRSITRQSDPITEVIWHPRGGNVIIASQQSVWSFETRLTDAPNSTILYSGTRPHTLYMNTRGEKLYVSDDDHIFVLTLLR